ncbi:hypothetical protein ACFU9B_43540 [Streptomyces sp. NPDC057592]|uniref:hypothetical protein n=1 Tax=Streptomyces sp. NPDC057592 TaxID=3346175 RepID=UPI0036BB5931
MTRHLRRTALRTAVQALAGLALTAAPATAAAPHAPARQASAGQAPSLRELPADLVAADEDAHRGT